MWNLRLEGAPSVRYRDHQHDRLPQQQEEHLSAQASEEQRRQRLVRRRMSIGGDEVRRGDLRRPMTMIEQRRLLDALPRLFARLVASYSRSLAFLTPPASPTMSDQLTTAASRGSSSVCESPRHDISLDDEVD